MKALGIFLCTVAPLAAEIAAVTHPEEGFPAARTVLWTPLFQAAWDRLNQHHGGPPLKIEPPNDLMAKLDRFAWQGAKVMPAAGWGTWAGPSTFDFLAKANREATALTGEAAPAFTLEAEDPRALSVFGIIERQVHFERALFRSTKYPLAFTSGGSAKPVRFFGVRGEASENFAGVVKVLAYRPREKCHALELSCKGGTETVILYRPAVVQDFATACHWVRVWRQAWLPDAEATLHFNDPHFHRQDEMKIPYLKLDTETDFADRLAGLRHHAGEVLPTQIRMALEKVQFELHERGARVRVAVELQDGPFGDPPPPPATFPRLFAYDAPFFVFLWNKGAEWPYFGAWIGDASAMEAWK